MNSRIREHVYVACPSAQAKHHVAQFFRTHAKDDVVRLTLRVPLRERDGIALEREVVATISPAKAGPTIENLHVRWTPTSGPFPTFDGTLRVREDERYESFVLELEGAYEPPFGLVGAAFDAVVGRRIASETAQTLLHDIAHSVEANYRQKEQEKAVKRAANVP